MPNPPAFFDRQPPEIVDLVLSMATTHTDTQIAEHLKSIGVDGITSSLIQRFRQKHNVSSGFREYIKPASTFSDRVLQYIDMVMEHDGNEFTSKYLGLPGHIWTPCALRLCKANLIKRIDSRSPIHYTQLCSDLEMYAWYSETFGIRGRN